MNKNEINGLSIEEYISPGHEGVPGCGKVLATRLALKAAGQNTIVVSSSSFVKNSAKNIIQPSWRIPFIHTDDCPASLALGVETSMNQGNKIYNLLVLVDEKTTKAQREAEVEMLKKYASNVCYIFLDGKGTEVDKSPEITYAATTSVAFPLDIVNKVGKALKSKGPSYVKIFSPTPAGSSFPQSKTIQVAKEAFNAKLTPIYEMEDGVLMNFEIPSKEASVDSFSALSGVNFNKKRTEGISVATNDHFEELVALKEQQEKNS
jgi:pyruvate ferredoxin oxidoreductase beta subunit